MKLIDTLLPGCFEVQPVVHRDHRGSFVKVFQESVFQKLGLAKSYNEEFYSSSRKNVLRGMHFQTPPFAQDKVVFCVQGEVLDVGVDLRADSPTYGRHVAVHLSAEKGNGLYLPKGLAHGFVALSDDAVLLYKVSEEYAPAQDTGILWNSCGISWPVENPVISERDSKFVSLSAFQSPFRMESL